MTGNNVPFCHISTSNVTSAELNTGNGQPGIYKQTTGRLIPQKEKNMSAGRVEWCITEEVVYFMQHQVLRQFNN
jgi:hypothetical protein